MRQLIRTDGTVQDLPAPVSITEICTLIGANALDFVRLRHMGTPPHVMLVDDCACENVTPDDERTMPISVSMRRKPVNARATELYRLNCRPGASQSIVGDVVVCPDDDFAADEVDTSHTPL